MPLRVQFIIREMKQPSRGRPRLQPPLEKARACLSHRKQLSKSCGALAIRHADNGIVVSFERIREK